MEHITLTGQAYNPVNAYWGSVGTATVSFDVSGGREGAFPGQIIDETVTNFKMVLNADPIASSGYANSYKGDIAVFLPQGTFSWIGNAGAWETESLAYNFVWSKMTTTQSVPEPSLTILFLCALIIVAMFKGVVKYSRFRVDKGTDL